MWKWGESEIKWFGKVLTNDTCPESDLTCPKDGNPSNIGVPHTYNTHPLKTPVTTSTPFGDFILEVIVEPNICCMSYKTIHSVTVG